MPCIIEDLDKSTKALDKRCWRISRCCSRLWFLTMVRAEIKAVRGVRLSGNTARYIRQNRPSQGILPPATVKHLLVKARRMQSPLMTSLSTTDSSRTQTDTYIYISIYRHWHTEGNQYPPS